MNNNPCRACDKFSKFEQVSTHFYECSECGVYKNEVDLVATQGYGGEINTDWLLLRNDIEKFIPVLSFIEQMNRKGRLLDIGCSTGYLLWLAKLRGWSDCVGIDVKPQAAVKAKELFNANVLIGEFEEYNWSKEYDCIVLHHGIEHLRKPKRAIERALEILAKDGLIYMQHPVMQKDHGLARNHISDGHQYEWTFESFWAFLNQFPVRFIYKAEGEYRGGTVPPSQTWIIQHEDSDSILPRD